MWYVGIDWADMHHDLVMLDEAGKRVGARRVAHSPDGLDELKQFVLSIATSPEHVACIVETTHGLLISFLLSSGFPVYPVNPKMAQKLRKVSGAKTDQIDAYVLAKLGRFESCRPTPLRTRQPHRSGIEAADARPGRAGLDANSLDQPVDCLSQGLLSRSVAFVYPRCGNAPACCFCRRIQPCKWHERRPSKTSKRHYARENTPVPRGLLPGSCKNCTVRSWKPLRSWCAPNPV